MDPIKLVKQVAFAGVITLIVMGAAGFYIGYSAGRGDMSELRGYIETLNLSAGRPGEPPRQVTAALDMSAATDLSPVLTEIRAVAGQLKKLEKWTETSADLPKIEPLANDVRGLAAQIKRVEGQLGERAPQSDMTPILTELRAASAQMKRVEAYLEKPAQPDLNPVLSEIRAAAAQIKKLERPGSEPSITPVVAEMKAFGEQLRRIEKASLEAPREDPKLREELGRLRQAAASAGEQLAACQARSAALDARIMQYLQQPQVTRAAAPAPEETPAPRSAQPEATVVLYDSFYLKKDQNKSFDDVDIKVALQGVASRSARVDVNNQSVSIAFGERKEIVYNNMTCELNLTETDLNASQARFNIACKK
ncbi:MAG: hypothetical protein NW215_05430 [Hyphomicrobiales bacterium]|nr:hypothetical protein [Hyphomicrobiales bacterium]